MRSSDTARPSAPIHLEHTGVARELRSSIVKLEEARGHFTGASLLPDAEREFLLALVAALERDVHTLLTAVEPLSNWQ